MASFVRAVSIGILFLGGFCAPSREMYAAQQDSLTISVRANDLWPPGIITDLEAQPDVGEGQVKLTWTAPEDSPLLHNMLPVHGYYLRYSTCSVDSSVDGFDGWWSRSSRLVLVGAEIRVSARLFWSICRPASPIISA